jgi:hypothetical protein
MKNQLKQSPIQIVKQKHYFYYFCCWIKSIYFDYKLAGFSLDKTIFNCVDGVYPVQSIQYVYIKEIVSKVEFGEEDVFVDVGCAWGRMIGYLKNHTKIKKYYGIELNSAVAKQALKIFKNDSSVFIIQGNIIDNIPDDGTVFYLFNPFNENVLEQFIESLEEKMHHSIKLLYLYPTCKEILDKRKGWILEQEVLLKPKHFGTLSLCVYKNEL